MVVPTRNEGDNVRRLRDRVAAALSALPWELVVVDDSDDDTPSCLAALASEDPRVRVLHRDHRGSLASAVVVGARIGTAPVAAVMDADLQHPPEVLPRLLAAIGAGARVAVASRFARVDVGRPDLSGFRRLNAGAARALAHLTLREARATTDPLSGFFACRREVLAALGERALGWKVLLEVLVATRSRRVVDVPYRFARRAAGCSKLTPAVQWAFLRQLAVLTARSPGSRRLPLYAAVGLGGLGVNLGVYSAALAGGLAPVLAGALATHVAMAGNFLLHVKATWADRPGSVLRRALRFLCVSEVGIVLTLTVIVLAARAAPGHPLLADVGGVGLSLPATFLANDRWTWWH